MLTWRSSPWGCCAFTMLFNFPSLPFFILIREINPSAIFITTFIAIRIDIFLYWIDLNKFCKSTINILFSWIVIIIRQRERLTFHQISRQIRKKLILFLKFLLIPNGYIFAMRGCCCCYCRLSLMHLPGLSLSI